MVFDILKLQITFHSGVSAKCFGNQAGIVFILAISTIIELGLSESQSCFLQVLKYRYC